MHTLILKFNKYLTRFGLNNMDYHEIFENMREEIEYYQSFWEEGENDNNEQAQPTATAGEGTDV